MIDYFKTSYRNEDVLKEKLWYSIFVSLYLYIYDKRFKRYIRKSAIVQNEKRPGFKDKTDGDRIATNLSKSQYTKREDN